ncbi:MAG: hypothetical protein IPK42_03155 [Betaproteobacteria bacterium]|jgi:hypothetical protein|nr:hypothetical protein [Betaproteobacteria bacterium]
MVMRTHGSQGVVRVRRANPPAVLVGLGGFALLVGVLVYLIDRDPARAMLFPRIAALDTGALFGAIGAWLPSFIHTFAFSLFTAAALKRAASPAYGACAAWWAVNLAFEAGQHEQLSSYFADWLNLAFGPTWLARALSNYFLRGTFDVGDIAAVTAGALAAAGVLVLVQHQETRHA